MNGLITFLKAATKLENQKELADYRCERVRELEAQLELKNKKLNLQAKMIEEDRYNSSLKVGVRFTPEYYAATIALTKFMCSTPDGHINPDYHKYQDDYADAAKIVVDAALGR